MKTQHGEMKSNFFSKVEDNSYVYYNYYYTLGSPLCNFALNFQLRTFVRQDKLSGHNQVVAMRLPAILHVDTLIHHRGNVVQTFLHHK